MCRTTVTNTELDVFRYHALYSDAYPDSKTPAEAGVLDAFAKEAYLTTRKPGRLAGALA